jgi:hypothetical protein
MSDNLSTHCHSWLRPTEVLAAEVEMFSPDRVLYFNQDKTATRGMFTIIFNSILQISVSFISVLLLCVITLLIGPGWSTGAVQYGMHCYTGLNC